MMTIPGTPLFEFKLFAFNIILTDAGMIRFVSILLRSWLSIQVIILLVITTEFPDIAHSLRHLKFPSILIAITLFMYRYIFVLGEETQRLMRARSARSAAGVNGKAGGVLWRAKVSGYMIGQLFVRSYERSERVYSAMLARGYKGKFLTVVPHNMRVSDWGAFAFTVFWIILLQLLSVLIYKG